jgi:3-hydroxyacyl-CoA dehydrogenase/enoyl-CoA hydratase/carnithine racemase
MPDTFFNVRRVESTAGPLAIVTIDNGEDYDKPTFFGEAALISLEQALDAIEREEWAGLVLTGKPFVFAAGADIKEFSSEGLNRERAMAGSRAGHELFARIRGLPFPTVAAINGVCLGGGVEIALHCDARTISTAVRHFGAPEVFLGIIPAWGGTQIVPRLVGAETAVRFNVENPLRQNRLLDGRKAFELGFADRLLEPVEFLDESIAYAVELAEQGGMTREDADLSDTAEVIRKARSRLDDAVHGAAPAPYAALDLMEGAASWSLEEGYRREEEAVADLLLSPQAQASLYAFDLVEGRGKRAPAMPEDAEPRKVEKVGIVGAGLMASQLATLFLRRLEVPLVISDVNQEIVDRALESIHSELQGLVSKGRYTADKAGFLGSLVTGTTSYADFAGCDLVLEAVFEEVAVKKQVFAAVEEAVDAECVLATNTSSLSVTEMGADLAHPERLVGMHFFNPVAVMPLVELIRTPETDDVTLATAAAVTQKLRKRGVLVKDAPGFVVNRVLTRMTSVLMDAIDHGTPIDTTDQALLELGLPMAPSVLLQMVGPRVANHVLHTMHDAYPDRFPLSPTLDAYAEGADEPVVSGGEARTAEEVRTAALEAMADEIGHLLDEGVVADARDVDVCLLLGAGFPFFLGGITRYLDQTGVSEKVVGSTLAAGEAAMIRRSAAR